jgi:putative heme transporter
VGTQRQPLGRLLLRVVIALALVGGIFWGILPQLADLQAAVQAAMQLSFARLVTLLGLAVGVLVATWLALARLIRGATFKQAGLAHLQSTAVSNTVPGGGAFALGVNLRVHGSFGRSATESTGGLVLVGVLDTAVKLGLPLVLVAASPLVPGSDQLPGQATVAALVSALAIGAGFAVALRSEGIVRWIATRLEAWIARLRGREAEGRWGEVGVGFQRHLRAGLRAHGLPAFVAVAASHALQIALLVVTLRAVGVPAEAVGVVRVVVVYTLVRLVTAVPVTPGGLGVAELGLIAGLVVGVPGSLHAQITAAAILFRVLTYLLPVLLAGPAWLWWRITRPAHHPAAAVPATPGAIAATATPVTVAEA